VEREGLVLHHGRESTVFAVPGELAGSAAPLVVKTYLDSGIGGAVKRLLRGSRARRAWLAYFRLQLAEVRTPKTHAFFQESWWTRGRRSFLLLEDLRDRQPLHVALTEAPAQRGELLLDLARQLARAHNVGLRNRDLKTDNLLISPHERDAAWIDPDGVRRLSRIDERTLCRDLMRLNASFRSRRELSLSWRLRFLRDYARRRLDGLDRGRVAREVCRLSQQKWQKWQSSGSLRR
jgi:tRNA A-37 threonylcarbamoyl transferase component Bud32